MTAAEADASAAASEVSPYNSLIDDAAEKYGVDPDLIRLVIGQESREITMPIDGHLLLGVNDTRFDDNTGYFTVVIVQQNASGFGTFDGQGRRDRSRR